MGDSITLPSPFIASSIARLWDQRRYADVKMGALIEGDDVTIEIFIKEQPRVLNWDIEGLRRGQTTELIEKMKMRRNSELSDFVVARNKKVISDFLAGKGFRWY